MTKEFIHLSHSRGQEEIRSVNARDCRSSVSNRLHFHPLSHRSLFVSPFLRRSMSNSSSSPSSSMKRSPSNKLKFGIDQILEQTNNDRSISSFSLFPSAYRSSLHFEASSLQNEHFFPEDFDYPFVVDRFPSLCWPISSDRQHTRRGMCRRAVFTEEQRLGLELAFIQHKYIAKSERKQLAQNLALKDAQVRLSLSLSVSTGPCLFVI